MHQMVVNKRFHEKCFSFLLSFSAWERDRRQGKESPGVRNWIGMGALSVPPPHHVSFSLFPSVEIIWYLRHCVCMCSLSCDIHDIFLLSTKVQRNRYFAPGIIPNWHNMVTHEWRSHKKTESISILFLAISIHSVNLLACKIYGSSVWCMYCKLQEKDWPGCKSGSKSYFIALLLFLHGPLINSTFLSSTSEFQPTYWHVRHEHNLQLFFLFVHEYSVNLEWFGKILASKLNLMCVFSFCRKISNFVIA